MGQVFRFPAQPRVLNPVFVRALAEANRAVRQLRDMGCQVLDQTIGDRERDTEIVIDRNPHRRLSGCPGVQVRVALAPAADSGIERVHARIAAARAQ